MKTYARQIMHCIELMLFCFTVAYAQWTPAAGPWVSGYIKNIAASGNILLAGSIDNGVFRSDDAGVSWIPVNSDLPEENGYIYDCAIHDGVFFTATNDGLFRSTNNGATWTAIHYGGAGDDRIMMIGTLLSCSGGLFAGSCYGGMFRSTDNGDSWSMADSGLCNNTIQTVCTSGSSLYAGVDEQGVFRSTDNGATWTACNSGLTDLRVICLAGSDKAVFAGTADSGVFRSTDNGLSWTAVNSGLDNKSILTLGVSGQILFAGTPDGCFRSVDNGENWSAIYRGLPQANITSLVVHNGVLVAGTDHGILRSTENGALWFTTNYGIKSNITISSLLGIDGKLLASIRSRYGSESHSFISADNGVHWMAAASLLNDTGTTPLALPRIHPAFAWNGEKSLVLGTDTVFSITVDSGLVINPYADFQSLALFSFTTDGTTLFAGTAQGVVRSIDAGAHWIAPDSAFQKYAIYSLLSQNGVVIAGADGGVFISSNSGKTWTRIDLGLKSMRILALTKCKDALFAASSYDGIFRSTDNGATWNAVNNGLHNTSVFSLLANDSMLFAGTYGSGVFLSTNNGTSWNEFNTGSSDMCVYSLAINNGTLYAGTEGKGLWRRPLSETAIFSDPPKPREFTLQPGFDVRAPGPANRCLTVAFSLPHPGRVNVALYDVAGKLMVSIVDRRLEAGSYHFEYASRTMAPGCYLVRIHSENNTLSKIIRLVR